MPTDTPDVERKRWSKYDRYGHLHATRRGSVILLVRTRGPHRVKIVIESAEAAAEAFCDMDEEVAMEMWKKV